MRATEQHVSFLDSIRGFAVLAVFLYHCLGSAFHQFHLPWAGLVQDPRGAGVFALLYPLTLGWGGVAVFFAVSGFCIHLSFARSRAGGHPMMVFFVRRTFRIYPPYLAALLLFALAFPGIRLTFTKPDDTWQFFSHLFMVHNLDPATFFGINSAFWSLAVEVQLYLIYPVLLWLVARLGWTATLILLGVVEGGLRLLHGLDVTGLTAILPECLVNSPLFYWFSWSIGAALADAWEKKRIPAFPRNSVAFALVAVVVCDWIKPLSAFAFPLFSLATIFVIGRTLQNDVASTECPRWLKHLNQAGVYSYSIYLLHQPLIRVGKIPLKLLPHVFFPPIVVLGLCCLSWILVFLLARLMFRWIEQPGIRLGKLVLKRLGLSRA
ncbi:MAG: acyltransferase [Verrucomicrobiota bacterium]|jgi:peptidoglycan/LPS O-acetylase OafA/YrhL